MCLFLIPLAVGAALRLLLLLLLLLLPSYRLHPGIIMVKAIRADSLG